MEVSFHISWQRNSIPGGNCTNSTVAAGNLIGEGQLRCQYGCSGDISDMMYKCTDFSIAEAWTYGERRLAYTFSNATTITIGFSWIGTFNISWNVSTTFSVMKRNDTGRINSTPRAITAPVIRLQEGCNHTINITVNDADGDTVLCRWAQGAECAGICNGFPGADLNPQLCNLKYQANKGPGFWAVALMIEDFAPGSISPLSSVGLQFLVLVFWSNQPCSKKPEFIPPTLNQGACIAIPSKSKFNTVLVASSGSSDLSIREVQTISPVGMDKGEIYYVEELSAYYVNIAWTPEVTQENDTRLFCYIAINSAGLSSEQTCIKLLPGQLPPAPIKSTATPNSQLVYSSNTTWYIHFDVEIHRPMMVALITFHELDTEREVYRIDASSSPEVTFKQPNRISITPRHIFAEKTNFYINFERGIVQGYQECNPGNKASQ